VVCIAGPDAQYAGSAVDTARALRGSGAGHVWLAGKPAGYDGVDSYVYAGCDAVAVLTEVLRQLGVAA
jgi:methylmalonyl-CoA mutase